jgi:hypothetical protein
VARVRPSTNRTNSRTGATFKRSLSGGIRLWRQGGAERAYDTAGDVTSDGPHTYTYDAEGRITSRVPQVRVPQLDANLGVTDTAKEVDVG